MSTKRIADKYDYIHRALSAAVCVPTERYLWTPSDGITFIPGLCRTVWGDGRALFKVTTLNNRPAFWIIRGDSGWSSASDLEHLQDAPDFAEFTDDIFEALELQFGNARCPCSGADLYLEPAERGCDCEYCKGPSAEYAKWPMVDGNGGCSWSRMNWPHLRRCYPSDPHPFAPRYNLIRTVKANP